MNKLSLILVFIAIQACSQNNSQNNSQNTNFDKMEKDSLIIEVLTSQLKDGKHIEGEEYEPHIYSENDLLATQNILNQTLRKNGYNIKNQELFKDKIYKIFDRKIIYPSDNKTVYINLFDKCNLDKIYSRINVISNGIFIFKDSFFISELYAIPEILNYKNLFNNLSSLEDSPIIKEEPELYATKIKVPRWKDVPDLDQQRKFNEQLLINRNLYLFNDDKSRLPWLLKNDEYFMKSLVLTFGWTEDEKLLKWVIENNKFDKNNPLEFGKMFYTKRCDGTLKLHSNTFKYLQKTVTPENQGILDDIKSYVQYLAVFRNKTDDLTVKERLEILSNIVYFAQQYKYQKGFENRKIMSWMYLTVFDENAEILKQNNYFNLPKFKLWWDEQFTDGDYDYVVEINDGVRYEY